MFIPKSLSTSSRDSQILFNDTIFSMVINKGMKRFTLFLGRNLGLLSKTLPLLGLDKIVKFFKNNINLLAYEDCQNLVWEMLENYTVLEYPLNPKPLWGDR
jgi:hypothetical protein